MAAISYEISPVSLGRIRSVFGELRSGLAGAAMVAAKADIMLAAEALKDAVKAEFVAGTDKEGRSHNKTGWTLGTFHVEPHALGAFVIGEGAADLVYRGFKAHEIVATNATALHWTDSSGADHFAKSVMNPGWIGDDYVGRGIERADLGAFSARVVSDAYARILARSVGGAL